MTNPIFWAGVLSLALIYGSIALVLNLAAGWGGMGRDRVLHGQKGPISTNKLL